MSQTTLQLPTMQQIPMILQLTERRLYMISRSFPTEPAFESSPFHYQIYAEKMQALYFALFAELGTISVCIHAIDRVAKVQMYQALSPDLIRTYASLFSTVDALRTRVADILILEEDGEQCVKHMRTLIPSIRELYALLRLS